LNEKSIDYHVEEWRVDEMIKSPQQNNSIDCGVFLCANMFYISNGFIPRYTQKDIPSIRYRIAFTLLQNYLQTEVTEIV
jgi:Ulp1 family protease